MSLDQFVGEWEIRWQGQGDARTYKPGASLLIGKLGADACGVVWLDGDGNLCSFSAVSYDEERRRLHGRCTGHAGPGEEGEYEVDITFLFGSAEAINGTVAAARQRRNDDPLTGLWTADRRPGGPRRPGGERDAADEGGEGGPRVR
jgi:hypothetical protein